MPRPALSKAHARHLRNEKVKQTVSVKRHVPHSDHFTNRNTRDLRLTAPQAILKAFDKKVLWTLEELACEIGYGETTIVTTFSTLRAEGYHVSKVWIREEREAYGRFYYGVA